MLKLDRTFDARRKVSSSSRIARTAVVAAIMLAGFAASGHAGEVVDTMHTSAIAAAPISRASDRVFVTFLVATGFITMAIGGIVLTLNSVREAASRSRRRSSR